MTLRKPSGFWKQHRRERVVISAKAKYQQSRRASLLVYVYSFKGNAMTDLKYYDYDPAAIEALVKENKALRQQVDALTAEVEGFSRVYGATSRSLIKAAAQEKK
jgi:hypothetical protein